MHGGNHKSVLETTWAVAATNQTLGDVDEALKEYTVLLDNMTNINDMPVDAVVILHCAGKLFFGYGKIARALQCFRQALHESETAKNPQLKSEIKLNLANALSAGEEVDEAMELYDQLLKTKSLKKTKTLFLTKFNKSLLLIKIGKVEEAQETLLKMVENKSTAAKDVRGRIFLTLGNLALLDGNIGEALGYLGNALDEVGDDDLSALVHTKRSIAMAHLKANQIDEAISTLEGVLGDLSNLEEKSVNLLRAEIWNCLAHVYKQKQDLLQAKNFAKLALLTYKTELGETNPITLRNVSNLQLLLLEEAEDLEPSKAKSIIDAAQYELEDTLETFVSLYDPWTYRLDVASLKTNLGFVAVWQDKPKKARKLVCQIRDIPLPQEHPLVHRVTILEERLGKLEKKHGFKSTAAAGKPRKQPKSKSTEGSRGPAKTTQRTKKKGNAYKFRK